MKITTFCLNFIVMKKLLLFPALLFSFICFAQKDSSHVVTYHKNGKVNEDYHLNASGDKDGPYLKMGRNGKKYVSGQYKDGIPIGVWEYFASDTTGDLVQKLDFDSHKEIFVDPVRQNMLICGPRYFGGNMLKQEYIQHRIKTDFTAEEREKLKGEKYTVSFTIDSVSLKPVLVNCNETDVPPDVKPKLEKIVSEMPAWLPPVCKDEKVWRFSVTFAF